MKRSPAPSAPSVPIALILAAVTAVTLGVVAPAGSARAAGPLDELSPAARGGSPERGGAIVENLRPAPGVVDRASLRRQVRAEQRALERLGRGALERRARGGERLAQIVLGADFAREAERLAFAPAAANDALSDAVHWYSLAASRGFPGAPTLDEAGVAIYPIRVHRPPR